MCSGIHDAALMFVICCDRLVNVGTVSGVVTVINLSAVYHLRVGNC